MHTRNITLPLLFTTLLLSTLLSVSAPAAADDSGANGTVLETYLLGPGNSIDALKVTLGDDRFGGGDARASLTWTVRNGAGDLKLRVWRTVPAGSISFALLVFGIEVRGYNTQGDLLLKTELEPFSFGDSASGNWNKSLKNLPAEITRLEVRFFGNYE